MGREPPQRPNERGRGSRAARPQPPLHRGLVHLQRGQHQHCSLQFSQTTETCLCCFKISIWSSLNPPHSRCCTSGFSLINTPPSPALSHVLFLSPPLLLHPAAIGKKGLVRLRRRPEWCSNHRRRQGHQGGVQEGSSGVTPPRGTSARALMHRRRSAFVRLLLTLCAGGGLLVGVLVGGWRRSFVSCSAVGPVGWARHFRESERLDQQQHRPRVDRVSLQILVPLAVHLLSVCWPALLAVRRGLLNEDL